jgi:hypothetical protein
LPGSWAFETATGLSSRQSGADRYHSVPEHEIIDGLINTVVVSRSCGPDGLARPY